MWKNVSHMQARCGRAHFDFLPETFCLPGDLYLLKRAWDSAGTRGKWILKPVRAKWHVRVLGLNLASFCSAILFVSFLSLSFASLFTCLALDSFLFLPLSFLSTARLSLDLSVTSASFHVLSLCLSFPCLFDFLLAFARHLYIFSLLLTHISALN